MAEKAQGVLAISIDLELDVDHASLVRQRKLDELTGHLLERLDSHQIAATIAVADPMHSAATEAITGAKQPHEVAVLADATWAGRGTGRERLARELDRRVGSAQRAGIAVSTLALRGTEFDEHYDLLPKNSITALRAEATTQRHGRVAQPHSLRFGVWQMPVSYRIPGRKCWWFGGEAGYVRRLIGRVASQHELMHLSIDGAKLIDCDASGLGTIDLVLAAVARLRERGQLTTRTIQEVALRLSPPKEKAPLHSILRPAA